MIGPEPKAVLDVGTGTGYIALLLAYMGHRVTGIDFSGNMFDIARRKTSRYWKSVSIMQGDAENAPWYLKYAYDYPTYLLSGKTPKRV